MKRSKTTILSKFELEIMHVIWDRGKATVQEVKDALSEAHPGAYSTFITVMRRMEKKGKAPLLPFFRIKPAFASINI